MSIFISKSQIAQHIFKSTLTKSQLQILLLFSRRININAIAKGKSEEKSRSRKKTSFLVRIQFRMCYQKSNIARITWILFPFSSFSAIVPTETTKSLWVLLHQIRKGAPLRWMEDFFLATGYENKGWINHEMIFRNVDIARMMADCWLFGKKRGIVLCLWVRCQNSCRFDWGSLYGPETNGGRDVWCFCWHKKLRMFYNNE